MRFTPSIFSPLVCSVPGDQIAARVAASLLASLHSSRERPARPIRAHAQRLPSGERGVSLAMLRAIGEFYGAVGGLDKVMGDVCKEQGSETSICALTRSTGLSLAESVAHCAVARGEASGALVGRATSFFSYSWTGTKLRDMLTAVERVIERLEAADGVRRAWLRCERETPSPQSCHQ